MRLRLIGPPQAAAGGNTTTLRRWAAILRELGHELRDDGDVLIALHAGKSAADIAAFPGPVVVGAAGTDLYPVTPTAEAAFRRADRVVVLNPRAVDALPEDVRPRARLILQSVAPVADPPPRDPPFTVVVVGHLRPVKDPLLVAEASERLPALSRIRVVQVGAALTSELEAAARAQVARNPRYRWLGELPREAALRELARAHLLAVPSVTEGGANVVGEAVVHGVPPVATRIPGNVGLLGEDWPALFPVGDRDALAAWLVRWEGDEALRADLARRTSELAPGFAPAAERAAWTALLAELRG